MTNGPCHWTGALFRPPLYQEAMPRRVEEAEGVTFELGDYIGNGIGSLSIRLLDVEKLFWGNITTTDTTHDSFLGSGKIDPQLTIYW